MSIDIDKIAERLIAAYDSGGTLAPISANIPQFGIADAYRVLAEIEKRRRAQGWQAVGRKIGFTNTTIWARYGVSAPLWAHVWSRTVHFAPHGEASLDLRAFVQPRIEPEVAFGLRGSVPLTADQDEILSAVEWMAPSFEIVQCHFPDWKFAAADCTAAFGLHGALVVGTPVAVTEQSRPQLVEMLPQFVLTLSRGDEVVERGTGANVLGSPALALGHLARLLASQADAPPLAAGEIISSGTLTDAWPVRPGEIWSSDYGELPIRGLTLRIH
jgi:2-oxo-3-hexenedioate decarboxylase